MNVCRPVFRCHGRSYRFAASLVACALLTSCGWRDNSHDIGAAAITPDALPAAERVLPVTGTLTYSLKPGDELDIKFFYNPELNEAVIVRPDGWISLQLVGEVSASEKAPAALAADLSRAYEKYLRRPEATVIVRKYGLHKIYVSGEVANPGTIGIDSKPLTALEAIMMTGGFRAGAARSTVVVLRNNGTDKPQFIKLNLQAHLEQTAVQDIPLKPFDIVFVPKIQIAEVAEFFERYINTIIPMYRNLGFVFSYEVGATKLNVSN